MIHSRLLINSSLRKVVTGWNTFKKILRGLSETIEGKVTEITEVPEELDLGEECKKMQTYYECE